MRAHASAALVFAAALVLSACAGAQRVSSNRCDEAFSHADGLLRAGLSGYVEKMKRYAAARAPERSTHDAEARVHRRADVWTATHREPTVRACRAWPEEQLVCVLAAEAASELPTCGLEPLVQSFTDEVVSDFAARPFDAP